MYTLVYKLAHVRVRGGNVNAPIIIMFAALSTGSFQASPTPARWQRLPWSPSSTGDHQNQNKLASVNSYITTRHIIALKQYKMNRFIWNTFTDEELNRFDFIDFSLNAFLPPEVIIYKIQWSQNVSGRDWSSGCIKKQNKFIVRFLEMETRVIALWTPDLLLCFSRLNLGENFLKISNKSTFPPIKEIYMNSIKSVSNFHMANCSRYCLNPLLFWSILWFILLGHWKHPLPAFAAPFFYCTIPLYLFMYLHHPLLGECRWFCVFTNPRTT